tara:strand:- start:191 stop:1081 length:891 start_codon:yes stop_codon:yes gene_type:complete
MAFIRPFSTLRHVASYLPLAPTLRAMNVNVSGSSARPLLVQPRYLSASSSSLFTSGKRPGVDKDCEFGKSKDIDDLLAGNKAWVAEQKKNDPDFFKRLEQGQEPHFLYIGCSDSRVPANQITGTHPNEMFVHRNVANLVVGTDLNFLSVLHYAVDVLKVPHIIVCGHYDCGGVRGAMKKHDHGIVENWLRNIRDVYRLHSSELDAITDPEQRHRRLVELNVREQCLNIFKTGIVQRRRMETSLNKDGKYDFCTPRIHGFVYEPGNGLLNKLDINWKSEVEAYRHVYDLYEAPPSKS